MARIQDSRGRSDVGRTKQRQHTIGARAALDNATRPGGGTVDAATIYARLIDAPTEEEFARLRQAMMDAMFGIRTFRTVRKQRLAPGEREEEYVDAETDEVVYGYIAPPDVKLMTLVLEQQLGKPALRPHEVADPLIQIITCVPGYELDPALEGKGGAPAGGAYDGEAEEEGAGSAAPVELAALGAEILLDRQDDLDDLGIDLDEEER